MKITQQRKVYAAFLGLAAVAFVGDRLMLQPASVGAAPPAEEASEKVVKAEPGQLGKAAPSGPSLASKLQNAAPGDSTGRDPFRRGEAKPSGEAIATPAADAITPAEFAGRYELQSVLKPSAGRAGKGVAVVARKQTSSGTRASGRAFSMGNQVGGWTLSRWMKSRRPLRKTRPARRWT